MTISAAFLVKDPPLDRLVALIELLRPVVTDYVIVVDDRTAVETADIMAKWDGVTLVPFAWVDDFAAARNAALAHCRGDWVLHLDPDEVPSGAMLDFLRAVDAVALEDIVWYGQSIPSPLGYLFFTRNFPGGVAQPEQESDWHCRLFRRMPRNMWYRPVHELVMLDGRPEDETRLTARLPKAPKAACIIHSKPAAVIAQDHVLYSALEGTPA